MAGMENESKQDNANTDAQYGETKELRDLEPEEDVKGGAPGPRSPTTTRP
jgi:hypothetical protein